MSQEISIIMIVCLKNDIKSVQKGIGEIECNGIMFVGYPKL